MLIYLAEIIFHVQKKKKSSDIPARSDSFCISGFVFCCVIFKERLEGARTQNQKLKSNILALKKLSFVILFCGAGWTAVTAGP